MGMATIKQLEKEIETIKARNTRVEADKAWELSWLRKLMIAVLTYFLIAIFFHVSGLGRPFANAVVPTAAFIVSTLTLAVLKKMWVRYFYKK